MLPRVVACPRPAPRQQVFFQGGDDLGGDLFADLARVRHFGIEWLEGLLSCSFKSSLPPRSKRRATYFAAPPFSGNPAPPFVHERRGPLMDFRLVAPPLKFVEKVGVFVGLSRTAVGNAASEVGGRMLANVLVASAEKAWVSRAIRERGQRRCPHDPCGRYDCGFHRSVLSEIHGPPRPRWRAKKFMDCRRWPRMSFRRGRMSKPYTDRDRSQ